MIYALDTNTISNLMRDDKNTMYHSNIAVDQGHEFVIPIIVDYEVKRGLIAKGMYKRLRNYNRFSYDIDVVNFNYNVWETATLIYANLSKIGRIVEDADILIAALCLVNNYTLVTNNTKHFINIEGLKLENWQ